jgi:hypothetical protein
MDGLQLIVSLISGGLAGGSISTFVNRSAYRRTLRTDFEPKLNNMFSAYFLRMQNNPEGRYWVTKVGYVPSPQDQAFVNHRTEFFFGLIKYNELPEARALHKAMLKSINPDRVGEGEII